jgi:acyl carrier protein
MYEKAQIALIEQSSLFKKISQIIAYVSLSNTLGLEIAPPEFNLTPHISKFNLSEFQKLKPTLYKKYSILDGVAMAKYSEYVLNTGKNILAEHPLNLTYHTHLIANLHFNSSDKFILINILSRVFGIDASDYSSLQINYVGDLYNNLQKDLNDQILSNTYLPPFVVFIDSYLKSNSFSYTTNYVDKMECNLKLLNNKCRHILNHSYKWCGKMSDLKSDLELSSSDCYFIIRYFEQFFGINIPNKEKDNLKTLRLENLEKLFSFNASKDLMNLIKRQTKERN